MIRWIPAAALAFTLSAPALYAQAAAKDAPSARRAFPAGSIEGRVLNDSNGPVVGAMVSVVGRTTAAATTDRDGRYTLRDLPFGPYILSVHSRGYFKSRGRTVQLTSTKISIPEIQLQLASARRMPVVMADPLAEATVVQTTQLAGFGVQAAESARGADTAAASPEAPTEASEQGETAWRLRHLPRSILKDVATDTQWAAGSAADARWFNRYSSAAALMPIAFFSELPLSGQLNLMTMESFDRPGEIFAEHAPRSVAFVSVNTQAAGGAWSMQGAMTQGELASWIVAGSYKSIDSANHAYELGMSYSTQRYDGGNAAALGAIRENARNVGSIYGYDEWTVSPRLVLGYGTGYARYDYLDGNGRMEPAAQHHRAAARFPGEGTRFEQSARARRRGVRTVGDRHVAASRADVLVALRTMGALHPSRFSICRSRWSAIWRRALPCHFARSINESKIS